jgi:hypothetical protein
MHHILGGLATLSIAIPKIVLAGSGVCVNGHVALLTRRVCVVGVGLHMCVGSAMGKLLN